MLAFKTNKICIELLLARVVGCLLNASRSSPSRLARGPQLLAVRMHTLVVEIHRRGSLNIYSTWLEIINNTLASIIDYRSKCSQRAPQPTPTQNRSFFSFLRPPSKALRTNRIEEIPPKAPTTQHPNLRICVLYPRETESQNQSCGAAPLPPLPSSPRWCPSIRLCTAALC